MLNSVTEAAHAQFSDRRRPLLLSILIRRARRGDKIPYSILQNRSLLSKNIRKLDMTQFS